MSDSQDRSAGAVRPAGEVTAGVLRAWLEQARRVAQSSRALVDSLNVFPVPDSDTGTNVLLTLASACEAMERLPGSADLVQTSRAASDGAVRGARGNSGLLVSQALAALADVCAESSDPTRLAPVGLVHAYERIAATTWQAVSRPVTGTLLTVAKDAASAARGALEEAGAPGGSGPSGPPTAALIAAAAAFGAQESVVETAGLGHGPVDAGGAALMLMLTGLSDTINAAGAGGEHPYTDVAWQMLTDLVDSAAHGPGGLGAQAASASTASTGEFEVMYLLEATAAQAAALRTALERIGDSVGVVGTPDALGVGLYQVHVHTDTPRAALPRQGRARQVCVHHLHPTVLALTAPWEPVPLPVAQADGDGHVVSFERLAARRARREAAQRDESVRLHPSQYTGTHDPGARGGAGRVGVVACTRAPGLVEQLARTGAVVVLDPERDGIVRATGDLGLPRVVVLPCDPACAASAHEAARFLAARSAASTVRGASGVETTPEAGDPVQLIVCDTDDEARVLAAAVAVAGQAGTAGLAGLTRRASQAAVAVRTTALEGPSAEPEAVARTLGGLLRPDDELVTVILGRDALPDVGALATAAVSSYCEKVLADPDRVEVVVHAGGQADPEVLLAIE
ncbi:DAK2 domain-containing protein [Actinomyces howellii]|uniref:DAK2 domain fusion protein YloV n=1 Tax=Actinomyces howellii TaxID=52771 RepID=A0A3S4QZ32_9ACTO|nr:DAK2 domain-containing protein [Actinomyces howellii]VEG25564.1 DAK2 domain fusion protein YloV [Actinomyces howellii]